jgi:hypothetical protein
VPVILYPVPVILYPISHAHVPQCPIPRPIQPLRDKSVSAAGEESLRGVVSLAGEESLHGDLVCPQLVAPDRVPWDIDKGRDEMAPAVRGLGVVSQEKEKMWQMWRSLPDINIFGDFVIILCILVHDSKD